jgi:hypothetical protein
MLIKNKFPKCLFAILLLAVVFMFYTINMHKTYEKMAVTYVTYDLNNIFKQFNKKLPTKADYNLSSLLTRKLTSLDFHYDHSIHNMVFSDDLRRFICKYIHDNSNDLDYVLRSDISYLTIEETISDLRNKCKNKFKNNSDPGHD